MSKKRKHVFIVGLDDFNRSKLERLPHAAECDFHPALEFSDIRNVDSFDMPALIEKACDNIRAAEVSPDAIVAFYDFPATDLVPVLAQRFGTCAPTLEAVLKCEHKYWSRLEQQKVIADHIPQFYAFDPADRRAWRRIPLLPPYWIKPIKSFRSYLAFCINNQHDFKRATRRMQQEIAYLSQPFNYLFETFGLPAEIGRMPQSCMAESPLSGSMCTVEGYVFDGEVVVYGVVDSVRELDRSSFAHYQYPSSMPLQVKLRMADVARRAISEIGLDNSAFNVEFFWDQTFNRIGLLEINPRMSQAHCDLFEKVHGISHHAVMLDVALGRRPSALKYRGQFRLAGHFMLRTFEDGLVKSVPGQDQIQQIVAEMPGTLVNLCVKPGQCLAELKGQDSYSYELAVIHIGAQDQDELLQKYRRCVDLLSFDICSQT